MVWSMCPHLSLLCGPIAAGPIDGIIVDTSMLFTLLLWDGNETHDQFTSDSKWFVY